MAQDDRIEQAIEALAADREHGATDLARAALDILRQAADSPASLNDLGDRVASARPTMAALKNVVAKALAGKPATVGEAKRTIDGAEAWLGEASKATVREAAALLTDGTTMVTCSFSRTVVQACEAAARDGKRLRVIALASQSGGIAYGERMANALSAVGVSAEMQPDDIDLGSLGVTLMLVGADRVLPDGSFVNGTPTLTTARRMRGIAPLYVAAEKFKLDDADVVEEGFDQIPAELVTGYATDRGVARPDEVWRRRQSA